MTKVKEDVVEVVPEVNVVTTNTFEYRLEGDKAVYDMHRYTHILNVYKAPGEYQDDTIKVTVKAL